MARAVSRASPVAGGGPGSLGVPPSSAIALRRTRSANRGNGPASGRGAGIEGRLSVAPIGLTVPMQVDLDNVPVGSGQTVFLPGSLRLLDALEVAGQLPVRDVAVGGLPLL